MLLATWAAAAPIAAQPMPEADIPPALRPWIPWALDGSPAWGCTLADGRPDDNAGGQPAPICVWPGDLSLEVAEDGGTFLLEATSDRRTPLALPGRARHWPREVTIDGRPAVVLSVGGVPTMWLEPGTHRVEGRFVWAAPPETLAVPDAIARITLVRDGVATQGSRGAGGEVWLRGTAAEATEEEQVGLEVHRRIADGSPLELSTRIVVRAAGRARELRLPRVLPEGVVPVEVSADLPVRLLASGELAIQLHAGTFTIAIRALGANPETVFRRPPLEAPWPEQEVWVWAPDEAFRQVQLEGAAGIDPQRTSLPDEWRGSSAYLVDASTALTLRTLRRGEPTPPPNHLGLQREVWLDLDGNGFTARDLLTLEMHSAHRIELAAGELGRVSLDGQDQLVTYVAEGGRPGLELRDTRRAFVAEWRSEVSPSRLPAVNWSENASSVATTLHVPPGWTLVHASGVDGSTTGRCSGSSRSCSSPPRWGASTVFSGASSRSRAWASHSTRKAPRSGSGWRSRRWPVCTGRCASGRSSAWCAGPTPRSGSARSWRWFGSPERSSSSRSTRSSRPRRSRGPTSMCSMSRCRGANR
jgi:hypothetical protein